MPLIMTKPVVVRVRDSTLQCPRRVPEHSQWSVNDS